MLGTYYTELSEGVVFLELVSFPYERSVAFDVTLSRARNNESKHKLLAKLAEKR